MSHQQEIQTVKGIVTKLASTGISFAQACRTVYSILVFYLLSANSVRQE